MAVLTAATAAVTIHSGGRDWTVAPSHHSLFLHWKLNGVLPRPEEAVTAAQRYLDMHHASARCVATYASTTRVPGYGVQLECPRLTR